MGAPRAVVAIRVSRQQTSWPAASGYHLYGPAELTPGPIRWLLTAFYPAPEGVESPSESLDRMPSVDDAFIDDTAPQVGSYSDMALASSLLESAEACERLEEAVAIYDDIVRRFGDRPELGPRRVVANALVKKAIRHLVLKHPLEAIAVCEGVGRRLAGESDAALCGAAMRGGVVRSIALREIGRLEESVAVWIASRRRCKSERLATRVFWSV